MNRWVGLVAIAALLSVRCATAVPGPSRASDDAAVRAAMSGFIDALNRLDVDGMASYFASDISAFVPLAQADRVEGRAAVTRIFGNFVERTRPVTPRLNLVPEDTEVFVSGDLGVVTFNIREKALNVTRRRTFVFARVDGRWLIRHFHASDFAPR